MRARKRVRCSSTLVAPILVLIFAAAVLPQDYPDKIRGYKVHKAEVRLSSEDSEPVGGTAFDISFGEPELSSVGLTGVTFSVEPVLKVTGRGGKVDFLSFRDFEVNGIPVSIEDYESGFSFKSGEAVELQDPVMIFVGMPSALKAAAREISDPRDDWKVTGTVFVFGRFRWAFFSFKRVVPVPVEFTLPNPLRKTPD